jgi:hypothetical protein
MLRLKKYFFLFIYFFSFTSYEYAMADSSYYPLRIGNEWNYSVSASSLTEKLSDSLTIKGKLYFGLVRYMTEPEYWLREYNNHYYCLNVKDSTEFQLFDFTADTGASWDLPSGYDCSFGNKITLISKNDTISTPAGTFYNCFNFQHTTDCSDGGIYNTWFVKEIGKIKYREESKSGMKEYYLSNYKVITSVGSNNNSRKIGGFKLFQNYPNPFNPETVISWQLPAGSYITLKIYDILGNEVTTLVDEYQTAGEHSATFSTQQTISQRLSSGIYFYQLKAGSNILTKKMLYLK